MMKITENIRVLFFRPICEGEKRSWKGIAGKTGAVGLGAIAATIGALTALGIVNLPDLVGILTSSSLIGLGVSLLIAGLLLDHVRKKNKEALVSYQLESRSQNESLKEMTRRIELLCNGVVGAKVDLTNFFEGLYQNGHSSKIPQLIKNVRPHIIKNRANIESAFVTIGNVLYSMAWKENLGLLEAGEGSGTEDLEGAMKECGKRIQKQESQTSFKKWSDALSLLSPQNPHPHVS